MKNEMLEEIWAARQRIARKNGVQPASDGKLLARLEADYPGRVVAFKPRKPDPVWLTPLRKVRAATRRKRSAVPV